MSLIQTDHLTFTHEGNAEPVFDGLSMQLDTDWKTGDRKSTRLNSSHRL